METSRWQVKPNSPREGGGLPLCICIKRKKRKTRGPQHAKQAERDCLGRGVKFRTTNAGDGQPEWGGDLMPGDRTRRVGGRDLLVGSGVLLQELLELLGVGPPDLLLLHPLPVDHRPPPCCSTPPPGPTSPPPQTTLLYKLRGVPPRGVRFLKKKRAPDRQMPPLSSPECGLHLLVGKKRRMEILRKLWNLAF